MDYSKNYFTNIFIALSNLANTVFWGGHHDVSVSHKVGYLAYEKPNFWWRQLETIIDFAFYPLEGDAHCYNSYLRDADEEVKSGNTIAFIVFSLLVVIPMSCIISLFTWTYYSATKK